MILQDNSVSWDTWWEEIFLYVYIFWKFKYNGQRNMKHLEMHGNTDDANPITEAQTQLNNLEVYDHRRLLWHVTRMMMMMMILRAGYTNRLNVLAARTVFSARMQPVDWQWPNVSTFIISDGLLNIMDGRHRRGHLSLLLALVTVQYSPFWHI